MNQLSIDFQAARQEGARLGELCADKAEQVSDFDRVGAAKFIVSWLVRHGDTSGEILTTKAIEHGYRPHDARAFGSIYSRLARVGLIKCVGFCLREKGHSTAGGRVWRSAT